MDVPVSKRQPENSRVADWGFRCVLGEEGHEVCDSLWDRPPTQSGGRSREKGCLQEQVISGHG